MNKALEKIALAKKNKSSLLNLSGMFLEKIPAEVFELDFLTNLNLKNNSITEIPDEISKLVNLKVAYLNSNKIEVLSKELFKLKQLTVLDLANNNIQELPSEIGNLQHLKRLFISENNLSTITASIGNLKSLEILDLRDNSLQEIPSDLGKLVYLSRADLSRNELSSFEVDCSKLTQLEWLNLKSNQLTKITDSIGKLKNLRQLVLGNNRLTTTPKNLNQLKRLERLNLSENAITSLTLDINKMKSLIEVKAFLNQGIEIQSGLVKKLIKRQSPFESHFKLIIDNYQAEKLSPFKNNFKRGAIGVIDFENKEIPLGHYKQISPDIVQKYELKDPRFQEIKDRMKSNSTTVVDTQTSKENKSTSFWSKLKKLWS